MPPRNTAIGIDPNTGEVLYFPASTQEAALRGAGQGVMESAPVRGLGRVLGGAAHALTAPLRGVSAVAHNIAGVGDQMDVSDAMLYGYDVDTGQAPMPYGTALRRVVMGEEQAGDAPTGYWADKAADVMEFAGNLISDPVALSAGVGAAGSAVRAAEQGAALKNPVIASQGAAKMQPKPKIRYVEDTLLDTDLAPAGPQNRTYSFPNRMREWGRSGRAARQAEAGARQYETPAGPPAPRGYSPGAGGPGPTAAEEAAAREALVREGFMDPGEASASTLLDTDLVRGNPATSRLRAGELADYLNRQEFRRGPGTGAGPGAAGAGEQLAPPSGSRTPMRSPGPMFNVPAEEAGAVTRANQLYQTMLALPENARQALMAALEGFTG
jgi:hypothetical protein